MKKIFSFLVVLTIVLVFSSCAVDPAVYHFEKGLYLGHIVKIELRKAAKTETPERIKISDNNHPVFNVSETESVEALSPEKYNDFCAELSDIRFHLIAECAKKPFGYVLVIYLESGNMIVLSCTVEGGYAYDVFAEFTASGDFVKHFAAFAERPVFERLLDKYFEAYSIS